MFKVNSLRTAVAMGLALALVGAGQVLVAEPADGEMTGSCLVSPVLPCSASGGQTYGDTTLGADGNDREGDVEAVLSQVLGAEVNVSNVASGLTGDAGDFDVTPDNVTGGTSFDWTYRGPAQNLAYVTVKAGSAFAVVGVVGQTSGSLDVTELLGGHDISHIGFWTTSTSTTDPVVARKKHGDDLFGNSRLAKIDNGTVPCVHFETNELTRCKFSRKSGSWIETAQGNYAKWGQAITLDGKPGGEYITAARINTNGSVPGLAPAGHDTAGATTTEAGEELAQSMIVETSGSSHNASGRPLMNQANLEICTSSYPHPDDRPDRPVAPTRTYTGTTSTGTTYTVYCYTGPGAALNDSNGTERDQFNQYMVGTAYSHTIWNNGVEVPAAKRIATFGYPIKVNVRSPIAWRTVASSLVIANS